MRNKITVFFIISSLVFLMLGLFNLQIIQGRKFKELSNKNCIRVITQSGARGNILDRYNHLIVGNRISYDVLVMPQDPDQTESAILSLSRVLGENPDELKKAFYEGYIAPTIPVAISRNINVKKAIELEELKWDLPNIIIQPHPLRDYPYAGLASHVVGYLGEIDHWRLTKLSDYGYKTKDIVGFGGIEEKYDYYLRQEEGALSVEVDHKGSFIRIVGFKPPANGKDVQLTLDLKMQKIAEDALKGRMGTVIMMDPNNGEVYVMASSPDFSPAAFIKKSDYYIASLFNDSQSPLLNRAISGVFPAGSVFKAVVACAALETGKIDLRTDFTCEGSTEIGNREFKCWSTHGDMNLLNALANSCDVFFYKTGLLTGAPAIHDYAVKFGLSHLTGIDLPYESAGFVPSPLWRRMSKFKSWFDGDTANFAIGQGELMCTPIQLCRMMAVFANRGYLVTPYLVKGVEGKDFSVYQKKISRMPLKQQSVDWVRQGLRKVVSDPKGTANMLSSLPVQVAGKTGSVQVPHGQAHAWFVGFLPYDKPRFVICVFLEHGGSGAASAVMAKEILSLMCQEKLI